MRLAAPLLAILTGGCGLVLDLDPPDPALPDGGARFDAQIPPTDAARPRDASRADAARTIDGATPRPTCGGPSALVDGFDGAERSPFWTVGRIAAGTAAHAGGRLLLTPTGGITDADAFYSSTFTYDARDDRVAAEVTPSPTSGVSTHLSLGFDDTHHATIIQTDGSIAGWVNDAVPSIGVSMPYDPTAHRWWQIRGDGAGRVVFEVSADGTTWTSIHDAPAPPWLEAVHVVLGASASGAAAPEPAAFDQVNLDPGHVQTRYCLAESFADDFEAPRTTPNPLRWFHPEGCSVGQSSGTVTVTGVSATDGPCGVATRHGYDLRESHSAIQLESVTNAASVFLAVTDASGATVSIRCVDDALEMRAPSGMVRQATCPAADAWRIAVMGSELVFVAGTSAGSPLSSSRVPVAGFDASAVRVSFGAVGDAAGDPTVTIEGYNSL